MGKLVEAEAFVPRHREIAYVELAVEPEVVEVGQVMSRGEMLKKLVVKSPTAARDRCSPCRLCVGRWSRVITDAILV